MIIRIADEIYVTYAEIVMGSQVSYVLPQRFLSIIDYNLDGMGDEVLEHKVLRRAKTLKEMRDSFSSDQEFFDTMLGELKAGNTTSVIIYADPDAFLDLLFSWWKTIMPGLTSEGAHVLWSSYKDMELLQVARLWTWVDITSGSDAIPFSAIEERYWKHTKTHINKMFKAAVPFSGLNDETLYQCPIEFMLMGYLAGNLSTVATSTLQHRVEEWAKKAAALEFTKIRKSIEQDLNTLWRLYPELKEYSKLDSKSLKEGLDKVEDLNWLINPGISDDMAGFEYILSSYDVKKFFQLLMDIDRELYHYKGSGKEGEAGSLNNPLLWFLSKKGRLPKASEILSGPLIEGRNSFPGTIDQLEMFREDVRQKAINPHLVSSFSMLLEEQPSDTYKFKLV
ncbi:MAG: hypothetical protein DRQ88_12430 [Epsilonproteobacteria bacterium]|nr:MAG: hypothetical protein DRQ88_12430 [Campylobacterota bacterium]